MLLARDIMRSDVAPVRSSDALNRVADLMQRHGVRQVAVVDDGRVVGIVSKGDLEPHVGQLEWTTVRIAMTADPITVVHDAPVAEVRQLLVAHRLNAVPVLSGGRLVGIVSRHELLHLAWIDAR
jgi:tRNA nucleotidyltransferase (CCA-adding enzyme)